MNRNFPTITPGLLYHDAPEMIKWLCEVFDFEQKTLIPGQNGGILHAHLTFANGGVMLSSVENYEYAHWCRSPLQTGISTVEIIVFVEDIEKHYHHVQQKGANIIMFLEEKMYGGKGYSVKDPEGYIWAFGSYDPWQS
ncbi:MAG: hypothetical protein LBJ04_13555 [Sphingobacterium sp.]|jgi:uncharacterized glyoxalase superfamily protein PhnB|nr:hypothetical protein [Sphingobacterium sp.]